MLVAAVPRRHTVPHRLMVAAGAIVMALLMTVGWLPPVRAASGLELTTPYPSIAVQPGSNATFVLTVAATSAVTADLKLSGVPDGWTANLHGGNLEVQSVYVATDTPATVQLDVAIPADATDGTTNMKVTATGGGSTVTLPLTVVVAQAAGGTVSLTTDFPSLQGASDATFPFSLTLHNDTPQQLTFSVQATGPSGWTVSATVSGQQQAASFTVEAGSTQAISVSTTPPSTVKSGSFQIAVQASGTGGHDATAALTVEITGQVKMSVTTVDGRLNANTTAGAAGDLTVVVSNDGTSDLTGVNLTSSAPSGWDVTFDPSTLDTVTAGNQGTAVAHIKPSGDAIAGDYQVTITAANDQASESMQIRVTVDTSPLWGVLGVALILAAVGGLYWVFQRYGRR